MFTRFWRRWNPKLHVICRVTTAAIVVFVLLPASLTRASTVVFSTDFESGVPTQLTAPGAQTESVQGYAGLGTPGNQFSGNLLRYDDTGILLTKLRLTNLPSHDHIDLGFLLAIIDSWDGTELLRVSVDGNMIFSHWFQLASGDTSSYIAPPGGLLHRGTNLGWSSGIWYGHDRAYDLSVEPTFIGIPHTADTLAVTWSLSATVGTAAQNWQGGSDESWGIDNLKVSVASTSTGIAAEMNAAGLALHQNAPNPFNPTTSILFDVPAGGAVATLRIYDAGGRLVRTLADGFQAEGPRRVTWDGRNDSGDSVPTGMYFGRLTAPGFQETIKMALLK
jgi:hypothetical protein